MIHRMGGSLFSSKWLVPCITMYLGVLSTGLLSYFSFKVHAFLPPIHLNPTIASLQQGLYAFLFLGPAIFGYLFVLLRFINPSRIIRTILASCSFSLVYVIIAYSSVRLFVEWAIRFFPEAYLWYEHGENHPIAIGFIFLTLWLLAIPYVLGTAITAALSFLPLREWLTWRGLLLVLLIGFTLILAAPLVFTASKFRWSTNPWFMTKVALSLLISPIPPSVAASLVSYLSSRKTSD